MKGRGTIWVSHVALGVAGMGLVLFSGACIDWGQDARDPPEPPGGPTVVSYGNLHVGARVVGAASAPFDTGTTRPLIGRLFVPEEYEAPSPDIVVLSHALWQHLGRDPRILGEPVILGGRRRIIVGIMPPEYLEGDWSVAWVPR